MTKDMILRPADEPLAERSEPTPMDLIRIALDKSTDIDKLTKLFELQERWERREAEKAFHEALAAFKENPPEIEKKRQVAYKEVRYKFAALDDCCDKIGPALAEHGLSYTWETEHLQGTPVIRVTCILTHRQGHSTRTSLQSPPDSSGSKNSIQALGSTITYLQRYSLLCACGIATQNADDDGAKSANDPLISAEDATALADKLNTLAEGAWPRFLKHFRIDDLRDMKASQLAEAWQMMAGRKKAGEK